MPQMAVKIDLSASSPAFIPEQAFVVFVSCVVRERLSKVTPWDTFTCQLTSHPFMPQQSSIRAWVSCTTHCTIHHCTVLVVFFFFYSLLSGSLALSLTRCECIDSQSTLTKWKQAAHLCPRQARRAYNQNNIKWLKKERDGDLPYQWNRWEIMQLGGVPKTQTWMQRGKLTRQRFAFPLNNINVNAHFLSKKWKFNKATLCLWLE